MRARLSPVYVWLALTILLWPGLALAQTTDPPVTVVLTWAAPTKNQDGTPLTDLKLFRVYWGSTLSALKNIVEIPAFDASNTVVTTYMFPDKFPFGTWYFLLTAADTAGNESDGGFTGMLPVDGGPMGPVFRGCSGEYTYRIGLGTKMTTTRECVVAPVPPP